MNWAGFTTLLYKELLRFWKVSFQTVLAPVITALLYLLIFSHVLESRVTVYDNVRYTAFLVPGLVMMSVLQNAFANSSSSLIQSKLTGNIVFILLPPLGHWELLAAYVCAAIVHFLHIEHHRKISLESLEQITSIAPIIIQCIALPLLAMMASSAQSISIKCIKHQGAPMSNHILS